MSKGRLKQRKQVKSPQDKQTQKACILQDNKQGAAKDRYRNEEHNRDRQRTKKGSQTQNR
eukprot:6213243-Pleurochrysis_carterae.AAC.2